MAGEALGFVGVGRMGGPMAGRLLDAGYKLVIHDTSKNAIAPLTARGAKIATSAADVASQTEVVLLSLPTPKVVEMVTLGEGGAVHGSKVKTIVDLSTTGPTTAAAIASQVIARKLTWIDSPVSGGVPGAKAGTLGVMVSCPKPAFAPLEPVLRTFGKVFYTGDKPGLAQTAKLCNNMLSMGALALTSEVMAMGTKSGLDPKVLLDIINVSSGRNMATMDKFPRAIVPRTFDLAFATGLALKDVRLCCEEGEAIGVPMPVGAAVRQMWVLTQARYGADADFSMIAKVLEEWAGVEIKAKDE